MSRFGELRLLPDDEQPDARKAARQQLDRAMRTIFSYWVARTERDPGRTLLTPSRRSMLRARIREVPAKVPLEEKVSALLYAVDGCADSDWHMESGNTRFDQIFRNRERVEMFAEKTRGYRRGERHEVSDG